MSVVAGVPEQASSSTSVSVPLVSVPLQRTALRWTPVPVATRHVARRPRALRPLCLLLVLSVLAAPAYPPVLAATALFALAEVVLSWRWSRSRRRAAQHNAELSRRPGRHARPES